MARLAHAWHEALLLNTTFTHQPAIWHPSSASLCIDQRLLAMENNVSLQKAAGCLLTPYLLLAIRWLKTQSSHHSAVEQLKPATCRLHQYPQMRWQEKLISQKMDFKEMTPTWGRAHAPLLPREHLPAPGHRTQGCIIAASFQKGRCRQWGRFLSLQGYHLAICYMLPTPLFPRLREEQKQLLIKIQNYKACLAERKQYLSHICFWEGYNSHKSWAKLYFTLINCAKKNRVKTNLFQSRLELKVPCQPTAFSFHFKKNGFFLISLKKINK